MLSTSFSTLTYAGAGSAASRLDARYKLSSAVIAGAAVLFEQNAKQFVALGILVMVALAAARVAPQVIWSAEKPILLFIVVGGGVLAFETPGKGWSFGFVHVSMAGLQLGARVGVQLFLLVAITTMLTYTTTPLAVAGALRRMLGFLRFAKVPVDEMTTMLTIAITFLPLMSQEVDRYLTARVARGASSNRFGVWSMLGDLLAPLIQTNLQRGEELALALDARLYGYGRRTYWHDEERAGKSSVALLAFVLVLCAAIVTLL